MKVWELMAVLSKMEAGKMVEFSTLLSDRNTLGEGIGTLANFSVDDVMELGDSVMLFSEERSKLCRTE